MKKLNIKESKKETEMRGTYGINNEDVYDLNVNLGIIISNALTHYANTLDINPTGTKNEEYKNRVLKHAKAIQDYALKENHLEKYTGSIEKTMEQEVLKNNFNKAMHWLMDEWDGFWQ